MDLTVIFLLCFEALLGLWLLYHAGVLKTTAQFAVSVALIAAAFFLRGLCFNYETLDYQNFLTKWVDFYRVNGGFKALRYPLGNYNIPYLYFLCIFSYINIKDLYLIKLLSCVFDVLLAFGSMQLLSHFKKNDWLLIACFFTVLFLPTVILNGALWAQCDSIYIALAVMALWLAFEDRPVLSMVLFSLSFGFKLQAVFILPITAVLWFKGKYKLWHFAVFPLSYVVLVLPAVALGKPFMDTILLYAGQTGSIGGGLNYNSPSIFALRAFWNVANQAQAATNGIIAAALFMLILLVVSFILRRKLPDTAVLALAVLFAVGIPFLLPHMHDRYFFGADILSLVLAFTCPILSFTALLVQFASLLGYHAYLKMRYLLLMEHGARALIAVLFVLLWFLIYTLFIEKPDFKKNSKKQKKRKKIA